MNDILSIALFVLAVLVLDGGTQLLLLILAHSHPCPRAVWAALPWLLLLPAAFFLALIPIFLLSEPGFLDFRGVAAFFSLIAALLLLAGWGLGWVAYTALRRRAAGKGGDAA